MKAHIYLVICSRYPAQIFAFRLPQHWLNKTRLYRPRIRKQADLFNILCKPEMQFRVFGMENRAGQFPHAPDHGCFLEPLWHFCDLYSSISCVNALQKTELQIHTFASSCCSVTARLGLVNLPSMMLSQTVSGNDSKEEALENICVGDCAEVAAAESFEI